MAAGRRHPPPLPHLSALVPTTVGPDGKLSQGSIGVMYNGILGALRKQEEFNRAILDGFSGLPKPHALTHLQGGSDALQTPGIPLTVRAGGVATAGTGPSYMLEDAQLVVGVAVPANPTGQTAAVGAATTVLRSDCVIKQGIVTTKGDLLTHSATLPDRLPVGADGLALVAASAQPLGLTWAAPTAAAHNLLSTVHGDTVANGPLRGALVVGNSTPAWARLAIGAADRVLFSDGTDASWSQVTTGAIANSAVTYAKIQNVSAASRLLGRGDSGAGAVEEITLGANLTMTGTTLAASGGGGGGPWTNTGALVHLVTASDEVSIGDANAIDTALNKLEANFGIAAKRYSAVANEPAILAGYRARGSFGAETALGAGDTILSIRANGSGSGGYLNGAEIRFVADGTFDLGSALAATNIDFYVDAGDGLGPQVRFRMESPGFLLGGLLSGTGSLLGVMEVASDLSIATAAVSAKSVVNSHDPLEALALARVRPDGTNPNADFGVDQGWWLQAADVGVLAQAARIRAAWEVNQTDDTTARDSYLSFATMLNNSLAERLRINSAGALVPGIGASQDIGLTATRWASAYLSSGLSVGVNSSGAGASVHSALNAQADQWIGELASATGSNSVIRRSRRTRGTLSAHTTVSSFDFIRTDSSEADGGSGYLSLVQEITYVQSRTAGNDMSGTWALHTRQSGAGGAMVPRVEIDQRGIIMGDQATSLANAATEGFFYVRGITNHASPGTPPAGTPTTHAGAFPVTYEPGPDILWIYDGANWNAH